jgi:hypothetical protein
LTRAAAAGKLWRFGDAGGMATLWRGHVNVGNSAWPPNRVAMPPFKKGSAMSRPKKILLAALGVLVAGVVALVVALKVPPDAYRRTVVLGSDLAEAERFDEEVVNKVLNMMGDKSRRTVLDVTVTEAMINARIGQALAEMEEGGRPLPPVVRDARIAFEPGRVVLATRVGHGATAVVVSQELHLAVGPDGMLVTEVEGLSAGVLPIPGVLPMPGGLMDQARAILAHEVARLEEKGDGGDNAEILRAFKDALDGRPVPLGKGSKQVVLDRIEIDRGVMHIVGHRSPAAEKPSKKPPAAAEPEAAPKTTDEFPAPEPEPATAP